MPAHELYGRIGSGSKPRLLGPKAERRLVSQMREILRSFTEDARILSPSRPHLLCWELCEQCEKA